MEFPDSYGSPDVWNRYTKLARPSRTEPNPKIEVFTGITNEEATITATNEEAMITVTDEDATLTIISDVNTDMNTEESTENDDNVILSQEETESVVVDIYPKSISNHTSHPVQQPGSQLSLYWQYFTPVYNSMGRLLHAFCKHCLLSVSPKPHRLEMHLKANTSCRLEPKTHRENATENPSPESTVTIPNTSNKTKESDDESCFICGKRPNRRDRRTFETFFSYPSSWSQSMGQSLGKLLDLDDTLYPILSYGRYCAICAQLTRDINWIQRSIISLNSKLTDLRDTVVCRIGNSSYASSHRGRLSSDWKSSKVAFVKNLKSRSVRYEHQQEAHLQKLISRKMTDSSEVIIPDDSPKVEPLKVEVESDDYDYDPFADPPLEVDSDDMEWVPCDNADKAEDTKKSPKKRKAEKKPSLEKTIKTEKSSNLESKWTKWNQHNIPCPIANCPRRFNRPCKLDMHFRRDHQNDVNPYHCVFPGCEAKFSSRKKMGIHRRTHANDRILKRMEKRQENLNLPCPIDGCERIFKRQRLLNDHVQHFHYPKLNFLHCQYCNKSFRKGPEEEVTANEVREHEALHLNHPVPFSCVLSNCAESFVTSRDLRRHVGAEHEEARFRCVLCPATAYSRKSALAEHRRRCHPGKVEPLRCDVPVCSFVTTRPLTLRAHAVAHSNERPFQCEQCPMAYKTKRNLKNHFSVVHSTETPYTCPHCKLGFKSTRLLNLHEITHTDNPTSHLCAGCGKEFGSVNSLTAHIKYRCSNGPTRSEEEVMAHREKCRAGMREKRLKWRKLYGYDRLPPSGRKTRKVTGVSTNSQSDIETFVFTESFEFHE